MQSLVAEPYPHIRLQPTESEHLVYATTPPDEQLARGEVLGIDDFHLASEVARTTIAVGTRVMKEVAGDLHEGDELPFSILSSLGGGRLGRTIFLDKGYVTARLRDYYIKTQSLLEHLTGLSRADAVQLYGAKGRLVLHAVLFDEYIGPDPETPQPDEPDE